MGATRREVQASGDLVMAPRVPHGLAAAVEGLTREVIRHRPEDIYDFAAQHFEQLLHLRDQYGAVTNLPGRSGNTAALREMNRSLKQRYGSRDERGGINEVTNEGRRVGGGWSLNETAKVMERHRSIFGDEGQRMSPEDVRALANEKENKSFSGKSRSGRRTKSRGDVDNVEARQSSTERYARRTKEREQKSKNDNCGVKIDSDGAPILMTRIGAIAGTGCMLAKDIKSELRKNRNGSRDGQRRERNDLELGGTRLGIGRRDDSARRSDARVNKWNRSADRSETDNQKYKTEVEDARSRSAAGIPRALSMDRVRDSVVKKFRTSESWDDVVSTKYVDKVQEVIDETAPTIREKVRELSNVVDVARSRQEGYRSVDESTSTSEKSNQTDDVRSRSAISRSRRSRKSAGRDKCKESVGESRGNDSLEGIETLASEVEARGATMADGKEEIRENLENRSRQRLGKNGRVSGESDASDYSDATKKMSGSSNLSLPAVRPLSSRNTSRSVSRSDSDNLILPPISPEVSKPARQKETLVLPCLSPSMVATSAVDTSRTGDNIGNRSRVSEIGETVDPALFEDSEEPELNLPDAPTDEIFKDSLNVTPEIFDAPPRPDSLEPVGDNEKSERNVTDFRDEAREIGKEMREEAGETGENNTVREKLMEIEETEKRIEQIFAPPMEKSEEIEEDGGSMRRKLMEIEAVERRIESAFQSAIVEKPETAIGGEEILEIDKKDRQVESTDVGSTVPGIFANEGRPAGENSTASVSQELARDPRDLDGENECRSAARSADEPRFEEIGSRASDFLQNSYILTEGSPLEVPDSVTTVIIPDLGSVVEKTNPETRGSAENTEISVGLDELEANAADKLVEVLEGASTANERSKALPELVSGRQDDFEQIGKELADSGDSELQKARVPSVESADTTLGGGEVTGRVENTKAKVLEKYVATDSTSTGSTDEVKETTISDDNGISGAESSVTSQFCDDFTDPRNSESSNEVKETTISDRPAEDVAQQNLYNLAPRCYGSMPHVPELNLDSLQDITVSSFQLSDDAATKEDSATSQESGENATPFAEMIEDVAVARDEAGVVEDVIAKEQVAIREDPCVKLTTYVTEPDTEISKLDASDAKTASPTIKVIEESSVESTTKQLPESNRSETDSLRDFEELENRVSKTDLQKKHSAPEANVTIISTDNGSPTIETSKPSNEILETVVYPAEKSQDLASKLPENTDLLLLSPSRGDESKSVVAPPTVVPTKIDITSAFGDIVVAESIEHDADGVDPLFVVEENVPSHPNDSSVALVPETLTEAETLVPTAEHHARSSASSVTEIIDSGRSTGENNPSSAFSEVVVPTEGVESSVTIESGALPEGPSSALAVVTDSIGPADTKETLIPGILEKPSASAIRESDEATAVQSPLPETLQPEMDKTIVVSEELVSEESPDADEPITAVVFQVSDSSVPQSTDVPEDSASTVVAGPLIVPPEKEVNSGLSRVTDDSNEPSVDSATDNELRPGSTTAAKDHEIVAPATSEAVVSPILPDRSDEIGRVSDTVVEEHVDPPRAEVVTNDLDGEGAFGERLEYHIYVPEVTGSEESTTTESSTFNSAATKIQAGVRGFLTRRRLQSAQRRSSTLDSVPSILDSFATDATHLEPIEELGLGQAATTIQSNYRGYKARQRLRREDAVQKTTLSVENAFSETGLQHTGEFHDCLPLPTLKMTSASSGPEARVENDEDTASSFRHSEESGSGRLDSTKETTDVDGEEEETSDCGENRFGKYSLSTDATGNTAETHPILRGLSAVLAIGSPNALQDQYLNFITSIEEVRDETIAASMQDDLLGRNVGVDSSSMDKANEVSWGSIREPLAIPGTPTGVLIEELSRTDDSIATTDETCGLNLSEEKSLTNVSLSLPGLSLEPEVEEVVVVSKPVEEASGVGSENEPSTKIKPILEVTVTPGDLLKLTSRSEGSQLGGERAESPVTMMQIVPRSVDEKSDAELVGSVVAEERREEICEKWTNERVDDSANNEELPADEVPKDESNVKLLGTSSTEESTSGRLSETYSLEK